MKSQHLIKEFITLALLLITILGWAKGEMRTLENRDQISWDGSYYDFRDADGIKMIKLWIPPGIHPVKGVFP